MEKDDFSLNDVSPNMERERFLLIEPEILEEILADLSQNLNVLEENINSTDLSESDRRRLRGTRARRYGFIMEVATLAQSNMRFAPRNWSYEDLQELINQIDLLRNIKIRLAQLDRNIKDQLLRINDAAYRMALLFYACVQDFARLHEETATTLYNRFREFFKHQPKDPEEPKQPTQKEIEHDVNALIKGLKEGKITIENIKPHTIPGSQFIAEETAPPHLSFTKTCSNCGTNNLHQANCCMECGTKI
jgi:hypothetical protein